MFSARSTPDEHQRGQLRIGKILIPLNDATHSASLVPVTGKEARRYQLVICYGPSHKRVTLRVATSAMYETWWAALENAFSAPRFVVVDAPSHQVTLAPVLPAKHGVPQLEHEVTFDAKQKLEFENEKVPMLEACSPLSSTELDILASWRTWGSLSYFATPSNKSNVLSHDALTNDNTENLTGASNDSSGRISVYSDISEFWSRQSESEDDIPQSKHTGDINLSTHESKLQVPHKVLTMQPQDDEEWLDEIELFGFRYKIDVVRSGPSGGIRS
ncbi:unnamed protein product [Phytophthora fragariaefolia]|uniref:Unnamed protein product n=1 Tax=Phytophthora fragariaefolia TaxID=1490495 RepID=A0A9W6XGQ0_9STRA|nr:unnamed protein product [Phytophthora fragariaefolia]